MLVFGTGTPSISHENLMAPANMQLVVNHIGAGCVGRNEFEAVRPEAPGVSLNILTRQCCRAVENPASTSCAIGDFHTLMYRGQFHRKVK